MLAVTFGGTCTEQHADPRQLINAGFEKSIYACTAILALSYEVRDAVYPLYGQHVANPLNLVRVPPIYSGADARKMRPLNLVGTHAFKIGDPALSLVGFTRCWPCPG